MSVSCSLRTLKRKFYEVLLRGARTTLVTAALDVGSREALHCQHTDSCVLYWSMSYPYEYEHIICVLITCIVQGTSTPSIGYKCCTSVLYVHTIGRTRCLHGSLPGTPVPAVPVL